MLKTKKDLNISSNIVPNLPILSNPLKREETIVSTYLLNAQAKQRTIASINQKLSQSIISKLEAQGYSIEYTTRIRWKGCRFVIDNSIKGSICNCPVAEGFGYCAYHIGKIPRISINSLSYDLVLYLAGFLDPVSTYQFSHTSPYIENVFSNPYSGWVWKKAINELYARKILSENDKIRNNVPQRILELLSDTKCEECKKSNDSKIYWPFDRRVCIFCLVHLTIDNYVLSNQCGVSADLYPEYSITIMIQTQFQGRYYIDSYLRKDVELKIGKTLYEQYSKHESLPRTRLRREPQNAVQAKVDESSTYWLFGRIVDDELRNFGCSFWRLYLYLQGHDYPDKCW